MAIRLVLSDQGHKYYYYLIAMLMVDDLQTDYILVSQPIYTDTYL